MNPNFRLFSPETEAAIDEPGRQHFPAVLEQLKLFLEENSDHTSTSLANLAQNGLLQKFVQRDLLKKVEIVDGHDIDDYYPHLPILMALAHEGGDIDELKHPMSLIKHLIRLSPQQFISGAGLIPGKKATQMYRDLCSSLLGNHISMFAVPCMDDHPSNSELEKIWIRSMANLTGHSRAVHSVFQLREESSQQAFLAKDPEQQTEAAYTKYLDSIYLESHDYYIDDFVIDSLFFTEAFELLERIEDTSIAMKVLTTRAKVWASKITFYHDVVHEDLVEQLVACAMFAHPDHFKRAGFGKRNLLGMPTREVMRDSTSRILAGPIAYFMVPRNAFVTGPITDFNRIMAYVDHLVPGITLEAFIQHSGINHPAVHPMLKWQGGHSPLVDVLLAESEPTKRELKDLWSTIWEMSAFGAYQPESLVKMLADKLTPKRFKFKNKDTESELAYDRDNLFRPAMQYNPGLKAALIRYLETLPVVKPGHLLVTGIEAAEAPTVVSKMHISDQGTLFSNDIGI